MMDRHPYRPAHFHFRVRAPGYKDLTTQVFERGGQYTENDSVFAVKDSLMIEFKPAPGRSRHEIHRRLRYTPSSGGDGDTCRRRMTGEGGLEMPCSRHLPSVEVPHG